MPSDTLKPFGGSNTFATMEDLLKFIENPNIFATSRLASYNKNPTTGIVTETYNVALYLQLPDGSGTGGIKAASHVFESKSECDVQVRKFNETGKMDYPLLPYTLAYKALPTSDGVSQVTVTAYLEFGDFQDNHVSNAVANFVRPF